MCQLLWTVPFVHGKPLLEKGAYLLRRRKKEKFIWKNCWLLADRCKSIWSKWCIRMTFLEFDFDVDLITFYFSIVIQVSETDKLPKIVCSQCLTQVETIVKFRETCVNAQSMLESCLNSSKLRNGGKVCIHMLLLLVLGYFCLCIFALSCVSCVCVRVLKMLLCSPRNENINLP